MRSGRIWHRCLLQASRCPSWQLPVRISNAASCRSRRQTRLYSAVSSDSLAEEPIERIISWEERLFGPTPPTETALKQSSIEELSTALMAMRPPQEWKPAFGQNFDRHSRIIQIVRHMVGVRNQAPNLFIYECMMDAMADPLGSADGVQKLLEDMQSQGIKPSLAICYSALAALAVHPDYKLRQDVLTLMRDLWFPVDTAAQQNVVVGLLRDEQYELAYARLMRMIEQDARIEAWVLDLFIMVFGKLGYLDEMLVLMHHRRTIEGASEEVMTTLFYYLLDVCSEAFHLDGTVFAWEATVKNSKVQPPDGIVENVLATAARHGKPQLATEALDMLSKRAWNLLPHHYEAVVEAFAASGDMAGALRILCIMRRKRDILIKRDHTRSLKQAMEQSPTLVARAEAAARALAAEQKLPTALVGAIVEARAEISDSEAAMPLYNDMSSLCDTAADPLTMQTLMEHTTSNDTLRTIACQYAASVPPGSDPRRHPRDYIKLIPACAAAGEMDLAFRFAIHAVGSGRSREPLTWFKPLMDYAAAREDSRIWLIVEELRKRSDGEALVTVRLAMEQMKMAKKVSDRRRD
ncbi:pentatricopeptide repeat protein [Ophiocordyceps camponoti-floridani]|uniref:Pentatricopeptide repeat protein n=1 Tax=Ophiocordyceps camponoti-floridani TaxID=2030778 RepID=A0A8H4Q6L3_9HYPO|nr:pentatricopeptide repeat protein [Ophiocordyceps camponoti-floridani]